MSARVAILCPGQGGQHAGMFDMARADPRGAQFLAECDLDRLVGAPLAEVLADPHALFSNAAAQPLLVAAQLAMWQVLSPRIAQEIGAPSLVLGYSIGELAAYGIAGIVQPQQAVRIAALRAHLMDRAQPDSQQGMLSVAGLIAGQARAILLQHGAHIAIETGDDTLIAGGNKDDLRHSVPDLQDAGARVAEIPVNIASHTPLMQAAAAPFAALLAQSQLADPQLPVVAGVSAQVITSAQQASDLLAQQLTHTVQWRGCMNLCAERGVTVALELGPGSALSKMLRERHPQIECRSVADFRSVDGVMAWLRRQVA